MTTDTRTTNRNYPLPYPSNLLAADVVRLRDALNAIDADMGNFVSSADVTTQVNAAVAALVASAPDALNTLEELSSALSDDENFATNVTASIATKFDKTGGALTGQITLPNAPTAGTNQAATALYVEESHTSWTTVNNAASPYDSASNVRLLVDTTAGDVSVNLPAAPSLGDYVEIIDAAGKFDVNYLCVKRNGNKIMGLAEDMDVTTINASFELVYVNATFGWRIN